MVDDGGRDGDASEAAADGTGLELKGAAAADAEWLEWVEYADEAEARAAYEETFDDAYAL